MVRLTVIFRRNKPLSAINVWAFEAYNACYMKKKTPGRRAKPAHKAATGRKTGAAALKSKKGPVRARRAAGRATVSRDLPPDGIYPYDRGRHGDLVWHLAQFDRLLKKYTPEDQEVLKKALAFARERHEKQVRKDGSPFIIHPVRIASVISTEWSVRETPIVAAGLLHDVIEDTQTTIREVKDAFGDEISKLVDGMTMWPGSETPEVYLKRVARGPRQLRIIKCADVLDNLRSWPECEDDVPDRFSRWWRQAHDYALPMAEETMDVAAKRIREIVEDEWYLRKAHMI